MDEQLAAVVGRRIKRLRIQSGHGLREQARAIGISPSSLSDLENQRGGISLRRLQRVAEHFGLHVVDLLADVDSPPGNGEPVEIIRGCAQSVPGVQRGQGVLYQVIGQGKGHAIQSYLLSFDPGGGFEDDMIGHAGEEFAYVLLGEVDFLFGNKTNRLAQGDLVRFRTETPHAFRNASPVGVAIVLGAATPPW
jgi:quercetin dioxygenase-like cupin family protein/DNA-binding Xre family transcriptional regulator